MLINCVAYHDGRKLADISPSEIHAYVSRPDTFVWVALKDPEPAELEAMQAGQPGADDPAAARLDQVVIAAKAHAAAYAVERKARRARDESIRTAIQEGVTMYAIAKQTGLTEQGVRRIRDAGKSRCDIPGCTITDPHRHKPQ